jgi:hypothetical protein
MKWMVVAPALSVIWNTVNYRCIKYSHQCVSSDTVQSGIYTINVLHKTVVSLIAVEVTSEPIYQTSFFHMTDDHFMVSFTS